MLSSFSLMRSGLKRAVGNVTVRGLRHVVQNQSQVHCPKCHRVVLGTRLFSQFKSFQQQKPLPTLLRYFQPLRKTTTAAASKTASQIPAHGEKIVGWWLMGCAGMVAGAVVLGGVTRLTESGLSMVDWRLLKDMKPPSSQKEWEEEFERYKQFPEYKYVSSQKEMTLSDFKFIYYMEYAHRMWGRGVGLFFAIPALVFLRKGWISRAMKPRLAIYASLIGFQGFLGWYMVKSGLTEKPEPDAIPRVSQYRLAAHLGSAIFLYSLFLYGGLMHLTKPQPMPLTKQMTRLRVFTHVVLTMVVVTAMSGAFVAGLDAGLTYNSWPKMADKWIPDDLVVHTPKWKNIFENPTTVQFNHRHLAESTVLIICGFWWMCRKAPLSPRARMALNCTLGMAFVQATLGISTLLMYVPTHLAATHQSGSVALLSFATWLAHEIKRIPK